MARPVSNTVRYFPHECSRSDALSVIESRYGAEGYRLYWRIFERLGKEEGHFLDLRRRDKADTFYTVDVAMSENQADAVIGDMVTFGLLDGELWERRRVVWSRCFVESISDAYSHRTRAAQQAAKKRGEDPSAVRCVPGRPGFLLAETPQKYEGTGVSAGNNPARTGKRNKTRSDETEDQSQRPPGPASGKAPSEDPEGFSIGNDFGQHAIPGTYWRKLVKCCGGDPHRAAEVFAKARNARDPLAYVQAGLRDGTIFNGSAESDQNPGRIAAWIRQTIPHFRQAPHNGKPVPSEPSRVGEVLTALTGTR